jgi:hypothetical protein
MANSPELDSVALTMIQAVGLLLPVVLLTFRFYINNVGESVSEDGFLDSVDTMKQMVLLLAVSGFLATVGVLDIPLKDVFVFGSTITLAFFFLLYALFIREAIDTER